jgi:hypothetical protein
MIKFLDRTVALFAVAMSIVLIGHCASEMVQSGGYLVDTPSPGGPMSLYDTCGTVSVFFVFAYVSFRFLSIVWVPEE